MKMILVILCLFQISYGKLDKTWWKYTTMYEVFLQSFKDGDGDGAGDLKGLTSKLDHFVESGIETIYVTPYFESPMVSNGYDITDFCKIHPMFGTVEDFDNLIKEMTARGLKLVIDLVINHSSDQHPWFVKSINKEEPFTNFYVWRDAKGYDENGSAIPPNNWLNVADGSAWTWNDHRKQFYLHQFVPSMPDFNLRNETVLKEIKKIFKFWLDRKVAGFRIDAAKHLIEDDKFRDEPLLSPNTRGPVRYFDLNHTYTGNLPGSYKLLRRVRKFIEKVTIKKFSDYERILLSEDYASGPLLYKYYGSKHHKIAHFPFNFAFTRFHRFENSSFFHNIINNYLKGLPEGATPCWNSENHDVTRKATLLNEEYEFIFTTMVMLLPGVAYLYYGQEIGMTGSKLRRDQMFYKSDDDSSTVTDASRLPMQWDDSFNAGFSNNREIILPLSSNYWRINVKSQKNLENSHYNMFKKMCEMRKTDTLKFGNFKSYVISTWVFAFTRTLEKIESYIAVFNLGSETEFVSLTNSIEDVPDFVKVIIASSNSGYKPGDVIPTSQNIPKILILRPSVTLVLSTKI